MPSISYDKRRKEIVVTPPKYPADEIKTTLGGRLIKSTENTWRLPAISLNALVLVEWYGKKILDGAPQVVKNMVLTDWGFTGWGSDVVMIGEAKDHKSWHDLYDFQKEAVEYISANPHDGALCALSPGLGKSAVSVLVADLLGIERILILAPLTLAPNWIKEFDKWSDMYRSWTRATALEKDPRSECVVTNHETLYEVYYIDEHGDEVEILKGNFIEVWDKKKCEWVKMKASAPNMKKWIQDGPKKEDKRTGKKVPMRQRKVRCRQSYIDHEFELVIIDESILLKNPKAVKVKTSLELVKLTELVLELSGSPTAKFANDLYPQVRAIQPRAFPSYWRFTEFFCNVDKAQENVWGWSVTGDRPDRDPQHYLRDFMLVRNQKDVLEELPDYVYDPMEIELNADQRKAFTEMAEEFSTILEDGKQVTASIKLAQLTRLAQITSNLCNIGAKSSSAKEDLLMDLIANDDIEFPLLIWTWWTPTLKSVTDRLIDNTDLAIDSVTGKDKREDKDDTFKAFIEGDLDILVCQMGIGKFGHTFTDTRTVYYHDRHWDSDAYLQSLRRVRRIGLDHRPRLIVPRGPRSSDPIVELNLAGKLASVSKVASHDLQELIRSLGAGMVPWSLEDYPE